MSIQESQDYTDEAGKVMKSSNPFIEEPNQSNTVVDMKGWHDNPNIINDWFSNFDVILDVMVLNDIIEQAAGRHSRASDHGGEICAYFALEQKHFLLNDFFNNKIISLLIPFDDNNDDMPKKCICCKLNLFVQNLVV